MLETETGQNVYFQQMRRRQRRTMKYDLFVAGQKFLPFPMLSAGIYLYKGKQVSIYLHIYSRNMESVYTKDGQQNHLITSYNRTSSNVVYVHNTK